MVHPFESQQARFASEFILCVFAKHASSFSLKWIRDAPSGQPPLSGRQWQAAGMIIPSTGAVESGKRHLSTPV